MLAPAPRARAEPPAGGRAEATRALILDTAERLFREIGYQKTAVADIAREAGMSPANVYRFFASKSAINNAICERLLAQVEETAWAVARGPGTPAERLRALFAAYQQRTQALYFSDKKLHDMVAAAIDEHWGAIERFIHGMDTAIRHILMDGIADGSFARLDPERSARLVHATMITFCHPTVAAQNYRMDEDLAGLAGGMAELVLRALRPD